MIITGDITVGNQGFHKLIDVSGMTEDQQVKAVNVYVMGLQASIMSELNIGDYKVRVDQE